TDVTTKNSDVDARRLLIIATPSERNWTRRQTPRRPDDMRLPTTRHTPNAEPVAGGSMTPLDSECWAGSRAVQAAGQNRGLIQNPKKWNALLLWLLSASTTSLDQTQRFGGSYMRKEP